MRRKKISVDDFAINHPAGTLGKKISLKVEDLMIPVKKIKVLSPEDNIKKIICEMTRNGIGTCLIRNISDHKKICGIITDGDLRRALEKNQPRRWEELSAKEFMTSNPITINSVQLATKALTLMEKDDEKLITILVVVDESESVIGLLRMHEIIQAGLKD